MKKLYKILGSVLICFSVMFGNFTVFAAATQVSIHYVYPFYAENTGYHDAVISVEFADYTEGTIVLTLTDWSSYRIIPIGARLSNISNTTNRFTFQVDDCKQFLIYMVPIAAVTSATVYPEATVYSNNTSYVEHVNQSFIESQFSTTNGYIDDLESTCSSIYTDVHNIYSLLVDQALDLDNIQTALTNISSYIQTTNTSLSNVYSQLSFVLDYLGLINTSCSNIDQDLDSVLEVVDSIESLVGGTLGTNTKLDAIITELGVLVYQGSDDDAPSLYDLVSDLLGILTNLWDNSIDYTSNLENIESLLTDNQSAINDILTSLNNIDNTLDTISWINGSISLVGYATVKGGDFSEYSSTVVGNNIYLKYTLSSYDTNVLYKMPVGTKYNTLSDRVDFAEKLHIYSQYGSTWYELDATIYYYWCYRDIPYVIFTFNSIPSGNIILGFEGVSMYFNNTITPQYQYLPSTDIEYWQLLQYFNQYNSNLKIISLLEDLNGFTDGNVDDSTFNSDDSTFDSTFNDYHDTTDSIFDTFEDSVSNLDLTDSAFSLTESTVYGLQYLSHQISLLVGSNTGISILFYFPLLFGVIMLFLGIRR